MRVLYIITGLGTGGAEKQLMRLLSHLRGKLTEIAVVSLASRGAVSNEIEALGIPVLHLNLENLFRLPIAVMQLARFARSFRPDVIFGWMYHGCLAACWVGRLLAPHARLMWGIRQSLYDLNREKARTRRMIRFCAKYSRSVDRIVYNSCLGREQHESFGFAAVRGRVIDNGFDSDIFCPDAEARAAIRQALGLAPDTPLIGLIARFHPMKGHDVFIEAAKLLANQSADVHFLLAGKDVTLDEPPFSACRSDAVLAGRVHLLGERADVPKLTAALDVASSSSWGEGFSNTLCEAMSCAVPVVATDVGDSRRVLGEAGYIVPAGDAAALAAAWQQLLAMPVEARQQLGEKGRVRVVAEFSLPVIADRYLRLIAGEDDEC